MKLKPLLLVVPCVLVLFLLLIIDHPLPRAAESSAAETGNPVPEEDISGDKEKPGREEGKESSGKKEAGESSGQNAGEDSSGQKTGKKEADNKTSMVLIVGETGSLNGGGYEPIYEEPDPESEVIAKLQWHCAVVKAEEQLYDDWIQVDLIDKGQGYVLKENVRVMPVTFGSKDPVRNKIIQDSLSYLGLEFVRYGKSLEDGIDCSNFIQQIYAMSGIDIPDEPRAQRDNGTVIPKDQNQPGDIVFYDKANGGYGHVAIFLGSGLVINCSGHSGRTYPEGGVRIVGIQYKDRKSYEVVSYFQSSPSQDMDSKLKEAQGLTETGSTGGLPAQGEGDDNER